MVSAILMKEMDMRERREYSPVIDLFGMATRLDRECGSFG